MKFKGKNYFKWLGNFHGSKGFKKQVSVHWTKWAKLAYENAFREAYLIYSAAKYREERRSK